jgi:hypothetical protein
VAAWTEHQIRQYPGNDYVITSRPHGYRAAEIDGAAVLQVRSFTAEQVARFVHGWYLAMERHSTGAADEDITARAKLEADDLLQRLDSNAALDDLAVNPLLLTMIANVHNYRGALPGSRAELYAEIVQVMLARRQEAKNLTVQLPGDKKEALLQGLAYAMMQRRISDLSREEVLAEIKPALRRLPRQITAEGFLADVGSNGLLVERETGQYCFAHHTFQEYLASAYIRSKGVAAVLSEAVDDPWWRETTLLYTARTDADPIVAASLDSGTITALSLAFDCADQGSELAEDLRDRLEGLMAEVFTPAASQERRNLITVVMLTRHLRDQIRTQDNDRICARPITRDLYRLFRNQTYCPAPDGAPTAAIGTEPACGMRASDALTFVRWTNTILGGGAAYHLPSRPALDNPASQRLAIPAGCDSPSCIWVENSHRTPELWVPSGMRHPHQIESATLIAHLEDDISRSFGTLVRLLVIRSAVAAALLAPYLARFPARNITPFLDDDITGPITLARDLALAITGDRDHGVAFELPRVLDRIKELAGPLANARGIPFAPVGYRTRIRARERASEVAGTLMRDLVGSLASNLPRPLDLALGLDLDLDASFSEDLDSDFDAAVSYGDRRNASPVPAHDSARLRDPSAFLEYVLGLRCSRLIGPALSRALDESLHMARKANDWPTAFFRAFTDVAAISESGYIVSLDALAERLDSLTQRFPRTSAADSRWMAKVGGRLQQTAAPVSARKEQLDGIHATTTRMAALCLAVHADTLNQHELGEAFREVAAGITLLERRVSGDVPAPEIIFLASE